MHDWFFEDFTESQVLPSSETTVEREDAGWFAAAFAPPPPASDGLSGWHVSALGMRLVFDAFLKRTASLGAPGIEETEWIQPVRVGDRLRLDGTVSSARTSRSKPDMGLVGFVFVLTNQNGEPVMRQTNVILVQRRTRGADA